jgi:hypothetical protein
MYTNQEIQNAAFKGKRLALKAELMTACKVAFEKLTGGNILFNEWYCKPALEELLDNILAENPSKCTKDLLALNKGMKIPFTPKEQKEFNAIIKPVLAVWAKIEKITI